MMDLRIREVGSMLSEFTIEQLKSMMEFVCENPYGNKKFLYKRALKLLYEGHLVIEFKIKEIYKNRGKIHNDYNGNNDVDYKSFLDGKRWMPTFEKLLQYDYLNVLISPTVLKSSTVVRHISIGNVDLYFSLSESQIESINNKKTTQLDGKINYCPQIFVQIGRIDYINGNKVLHEFPHTCTLTLNSKPFNDKRVAASAMNLGKDTFAHDLRTNNCLSVKWKTECTKTFMISVDLVHKRNATELSNIVEKSALLPISLSKLLIRQHFSIYDVDDDVLPTSLPIIIKCPISGTLINIPARGANCNHIECFDLKNYIEISMNNNTLSRCPICNNSVLFEELIVDQYIREILQNVPNDLISVSVNENGDWFIIDSVHQLK